MTRRKSRPPHTLTLTALVDPRLEGARCAGKAPLFDDELPGETTEARSERLAYAANICRGCPVRTACYAASLEHDAAGLWAGRIRSIDHATRKKVPA
ncbi:WhiB family transcriptional regulator [Rhodococcus sp. AH-ZY2]|uniref:WhiB family transcriptional regulator n=1 Tax=Rhodococcus sp. AH-ZY2 TaxID=3047468 RepID=UPI0027DF6FC5|nr:WhiB family transcriptional regulator [Rhodococcus sp. AH-ZY2]WML63202.1 WhiB family transcriptional regulator [Rhodococcus sp. AH-ZY2]